jgi:hypothetical protein
MATLRRLLRFAKKISTVLDDERSAPTARKPNRLQDFQTPIVLHGTPTWQDYEQAAAMYLQQLGFSNVVGNTAGADGGIDVRVPGELVGQVKFEQSKTGRPVVMQIFGVASQAQCKATFFSYAGYTRNAIEWANSAPVALFQLRFNEADQKWQIREVNKAAKQLRPHSHLETPLSSRRASALRQRQRVGVIKPAKRYVDPFE